MFYTPLGNIRIREYDPPPMVTSHSKKCPGDLEKFPNLDLGGNFRICEYTPSPWWRHIREFLDVENMEKFVKNMKEYVKNMKKYVNNMKEYVENMKEYE